MIKKKYEFVNKAILAEEVAEEDLKDGKLMTYENMGAAFNSLSNGEVGRGGFIKTLMPMIMRDRTHINTTVFYNFFTRTQIRLAAPPFKIIMDASSGAFMLTKHRNMTPDELQMVSFPERVWERMSR
jgi:hypothetical protein